MALGALPGPEKLGLLPLPSPTSALAPCSLGAGTKATIASPGLTIRACCCLTCSTV